VCNDAFVNKCWRQLQGVGSLFLRTDGGANTTLYIKESGSGNTGWVAK
jgi:peroxiredoxin